MYIKHIIMSLPVILMGMTSCSQTKSDEPVDMSPREVQFVLGGEFIETSFEPMSKADADAKAKFYAINIFQSEGGGSNPRYEMYAYGVFDSPEAMRATLSPSSTYKFECATIQDNHHKIAKINENGGVLKHPFYIGARDEDATKAFPLSSLNKMVYSKTERLTGLKSAKSTVVDGEADASGFAARTKEESYYPSIKRFYGENSGFTLDSKDEVRIPLKCVSFQLVVEPVDKTIPDGTITWEVTDGTDIIDFNNASLTPANPTWSGIYTFDRPDQCYAMSEPYSKSFTIKFTWTREGGNTKEGEKIITVKRNTKTTVSLSLEGKDKELQFIFEEEDDLFEDVENTTVTIK